jgi:hypothetical protein
MGGLGAFAEDSLAASVRGFCQRCGNALWRRYFLKDTQNAYFCHFKEKQGHTYNNDVAEQEK